VTHADVRELIACYALNALDQDEATVVREHLVECGFCANLAREASEVAHYLPYAAGYQPPPGGSLERLLATVAPGARAAASRPLPGDLPRWAGEAPGLLNPAPPGTRPGVPDAVGGGAGQRAGARPGQPRGWMAGLIERWLGSLRAPVFAPVAAMVLVALGVAGWNMSLMGELRDDRRQMSLLQTRLAQQTHLLVMVTSGSAVTRPLQGTALAPSAELRLIMDGESNSAMLMAMRLPPLPTGRIYQVWLGRQGARMPAGRLVVDDQGDGECNLQLDSSVHSYDSAWITLEPAQGGPMPNSPGVARGVL
jgi:hypothetical protein